MLNGLGYWIIIRRRLETVSKLNELSLEEYVTACAIVGAVEVL